MALTLTVHRSAHEIGGNCIELAAPGGARLILDAGRPLDAPPETDAAQLLPATLDLSQPVHGVLLSHPHQDHHGLLAALPESWPVHAGPAGLELVGLAAAIGGGGLRQPAQAWRSGQPFVLGPFTVTPYLTDHSAFDAYMLLVEAQGQRILYTGDFRLHGRKAALVRRMMARPPLRIDVLVMEGTNLGGDKPCLPEAALEERFVGLFRATPGRVFVAWSAQNIDRTVTLYRACLKTGRTLVVDLHTAEVMGLLAGHGRLPRPGWRNLKVVVTAAFRRMYARTGREAFVAAMVRHGIPARALAEDRSRWVVMTRDSLLRDYARSGVVPDEGDAWVWSMWSGYLGTERGQRVATWLAPASPCHLHTSGHASPADLRAFATAIGARLVVPVHGTAWDDPAHHVPGLRRVRDGEAFGLGGTSCQPPCAGSSWISRR